MFFARLGDLYSRVWLAGFFGIGLLSLYAFRLVLYGKVRRWSREGRLDRRAVLVGGGEPGEALVTALAQQDDSDVRLLGVFDDRGDERAPNFCGGLPKLGTVDDLVEFARRTRVDLVLFSLPISAEGRILQMLKKLWVLPVDIRLSAHTNQLRFRPRSYSYIGTVPVLDVFDRPIADWDVVMKSLFDKVVGGLALIALSPVMALTALAIKLDSRGPVLFRQKRYGFNNELIEVYKFRSMYVEQSDATAAKLVTKGDPRVTRVGRFIRKTSLDELPQLFNVVFKGNLSLVGPRPHAVHAKAVDRLYDEAVDGYFARHRVKPGITGWAQINGWRGETDNDEKIQRRVEHDLYYIENWSVLFDLYILAHDAVRAAQDRERVLARSTPKACRGYRQACGRAEQKSSLRTMTSIASAYPLAVQAPRLFRSVERLRGALLWLTGFAGAIVFMEPSPYEVTSLLTIFVFVCTGLTLRPGADAADRAAAALQHRLLARGGAGHRRRPKPIIWVAVSWYLSATAIFFAAMLCTNTQERLVAADARHHDGGGVRLADRDPGLFPRARAGSPTCSCMYDRAHATFNDPNVLGAFLVLPALLALQRVLNGRLGDAFARVASCSACSRSRCC